jgi:hypothetical protein
MKGRFVIRHTSVQEGQKHSEVIFATNSVETARAWIQMGEFIVWDREYGQFLYTPTCMDWALVIIPLEAK